jgi:hypothetical protein
MTNEFTSAQIASIASRGLRDPASLTLDEIQAVCGTALTQAPNRLVDILAGAPGAHAYYNRLGNLQSLARVLEDKPVAPNSLAGFPTRFRE